MATNGKANGPARLVLTRTRRVRGKEYKPDTVIAIVRPAADFTPDDVRKALLAGHAVLTIG